MRKVARANPITSVTRDCPPFLIVHGDRDPLVPCNQSELLFEALKKAGVDVSFYKIVSADHDGATRTKRKRAHLRNRGIAESRGAWIACCDSDDVWAPSKLERQAAFIRDWKGSRRIALLGTHGYNMNDAKNVISPAIMGPTSQEDYEAIRQAGRIFFVIHSSVMYSRADFLAVGGYSTEYGAADDFHFFCKMAELGVVLTLPEPLVYYRKRAGSVQLARFWDQQQGLLRLTENQRRRAGGEAPIGSQEFAATLASASLRRRL